MRKLNNALEKEEYYTYADYAAWELKEGERCELIDGEPYLMASPNIVHQRIVLALGSIIRDFLKGRKCQVFIAPLDVCLYGKGDYDYTVVEPDVIVVCDKNKLEKNRCNGAPDMVIEILSPSNDKYDKIKKFYKYEHAGVREYWMVDPQNLTVDKCVLVNNRYVVTKYNEGLVPVSVLDGLEINIDDIFAE